MVSGLRGKCITTKTVTQAGNVVRQRKLVLKHEQVRNACSGPKISETRIVLERTGKGTKPGEIIRREVIDPRVNCGARRRG